jgi:hypothetical protein
VKRNDACQAWPSTESHVSRRSHKWLEGHASYYRRIVLPARAAVSVRWHRFTIYFTICNKFCKNGTVLPHKSHTARCNKVAEVHRSGPTLWLFLVGLLLAEVQWATAFDCRFPRWRQCMLFSPDCVMHATLQRPSRKKRQRPWFISAVRQLKG